RDCSIANRLPGPGRRTRYFAGFGGQRAAEGGTLFPTLAKSHRGKSRCSLQLQARERSRPVGTASCESQAGAKRGTRTPTPCGTGTAPPDVPEPRRSARRCAQGSVRRQGSRLANARELLAPPTCSRGLVRKG